MSQQPTHLCTGCDAQPPRITQGPADGDQTYFWTLRDLPTNLCDACGDPVYTVAYVEFLLDEAAEQAWYERMNDAEVRSAPTALSAWNESAAAKGWPTL